jgi:hypothetical protein
MTKQNLDINASLFSYWGAVDKLIFDDPNVKDNLIASFANFNKNSSKEFFKKYDEYYSTEDYNKEPNYRAGLSYDIINMYNLVLEKCNFNDNDTDCIKTELYKIKDFNGATGLTTINADGGTTKELVIMQKQGNKFVEIN